VYVAVSRDGGRTFGTPVRVNDVPGNASVGGEQPPQVVIIPRAAGREPDVPVAWTAKTKEGTRLMTARSADAGASFSRAVPIDATVVAENRGWESVAVDRGGHPVAVWLDHRELAASSGAAMHHDGHDHSPPPSTATGPKPDGAVRAQLSRLFFARLDDPASAQAVTGGVCYCCKTAVATASDGSIYAVWRHVYPGNFRDIAFIVSHDAGRTFTPPVRVSEDGWALDGCPENGPAVAIGARSVVHVVWPTVVPAAAPGGEPALALFHAATTDGHRFSTRQRLPTRGIPRHPQLAVKPDGALVIAWDEQLEGGRRGVAAAVATGPESALRFTPMQIADQMRSEYPVVAVTDDATLIAWTSGRAGDSVIRVTHMR
jgi:hypothetical protein